MAVIAVGMSVNVHVPTAAKTAREGGSAKTHDHQAYSELEVSGNAFGDGDAESQDDDADRHQRDGVTESPEPAYEGDFEDFAMLADDA